MSETPTNPFIINLVETSDHRRQCSVCGGWTEKHRIKAENSRDVSPRVRVCETCLEAGDIDDRLMDHAEALEARAIETRALVGLLKVPTFAEWQAAVDEEESLVAQEHGLPYPAPPAVEPDPAQDSEIPF